MSQVLWVLFSSRLLIFLHQNHGHIWPLPLPFIKSIFASFALDIDLGLDPQVYPIQCGVAPMFVAIGDYWIVGETLNIQGILSVFLISIAVLSLAFGQNWKITGGRAVPIALFTGIKIAGYTVVDGADVRLAGDNI